MNNLEQIDLGYEGDLERGKRKLSPRRTFSVKGQLVGKLGPKEYGRLLDRLAKIAKRA